MPVENIARYQIIGELGKGAMGVVYKATDPTIGRTVALKTLRLDLEGMEAKELLARFKNEARAAGVLNHPNIVTIYDAGEHAGMFYIAMEFIEGATLQALLKQAHMLPPAKVVDIVRQVCAGLDFAHSKGIIHRDVKPANIMLEPDGTAKIMDFGIAKGVGAGMTSTGQVVGTPNYMSPEQVKGQPLDGRSDLFSLGVVMYEMLTGERPFTGQNVTTIIYKIVNEQPPAPHVLDTTMHPGLGAVVMKALAKAPDARYQDGATMAEELANYKSFVASAGATMPQMEPEVTVAMPIPPPALEAAAAAAATPAPIAAAPPRLALVASALQSTVSRLQPVAKATPPRKTPISGIVVALAVVALAAAGYLGIRTTRPRPTPPAAVETAAQSSAPAPPQVTPEEPKAEPQSAPATGTSPSESAAPSTEAAPVADTGEIRISSSPAGAQVKIDDRADPRWVTPFSAVKLKPGEHTLTFVKDGYKRETRKTEVVAGKRAAVTAELQALKGFLELDSTPAGAAIFIDGVPSGHVSPAKVAVDPGQHRVALRKPGFQPLIAIAVPGAGQTIELAPVLKPAGGAAQPAAEDQQGGSPFRKLKQRFFGGNPQDRGTLEMRTRPRGAQITINQVVIPLKTPTKVPLPPGKYRVTLSLPGFKPIIRNVEVEKGKSYGVDEIFEKQ